MMLRGRPTAPVAKKKKKKEKKKIAYFVLYLKIINTFLKNNASYSKLSKELKNNIKI